jgi:anti-sigma-K factor RskA
MSDTDDQVPDDLLAAEYALGVQAEADRAVAERRIARDHAFAALVTAWEHKLAPWAAEIAAVMPPPALWDRIAAALPAQPAERPGIWQSLNFWRGLSLATGALAAASIGALIYLGNAPQDAPLVAAIDGGGHHHFVATIDTGRGSIAVAPAAFSADATRVPELWLIPADGKPRPLGLLSADRSVTIAIPAALRAQAIGNAVLAVSLEPPGGSPTGQPTGPVIATGKLTTL